MTDKILFDSLRADELFFDHEFDKIITRFRVIPEGIDVNTDSDIIAYLAKRVERCDDKAISDEDFAVILHRFSAIRLRIFFREYVEQLSLYLKSLFDGGRFKNFCSETRSEWAYFNFFQSPPVKNLREAEEAYGYVTRMWIRYQQVLDSEDEMRIKALLTLLGNSQIGLDSDDAKKVFDEMMGKKSGGFTDEEFSRITREQNVKALKKHHAKKREPEKVEEVVAESKDELVDIFERAEKAVKELEASHERGENVTFSEIMGQ